jgi:hypothetical protein
MGTCSVNGQRQTDCITDLRNVNCVRNEAKDEPSTDFGLYVRPVQVTRPRPLQANDNDDDDDDTFLYLKVKFILEKATKAQRGSRCIALLFLQPRRYMGVGGQRHAPTDLLPGKIWYPLYRKLGGP